MTATSVVCPECGSPVAPGRLSCQSCGTLLASVVGSDRRRSWAPTSAALPDIDEDGPLASSLLLEPDSVPVPAVVEPAPAPKRGPRRLTRSKPAAAPAPAKARYVKSPPDDAPAVDPASIFGPVPSVAPPILHDWSDGSTDPNDAAAANVAATADEHDAGSVATATAVAPAAAHAQPARAVRQQRPIGSGPVPGSYLAPSATYVAPIDPRPAPPSATAIPAATAWPSATRAAPQPVAQNGSGAYGSSGSAAASLVAASASTATKDAATARGLSDWLTLGGALLVIISFVLPWATDGVIGSRGTGFTADWGLANPGHLILIVAAVAVLLLQLFDNPAPVWVRSAALPLLVGGILTGLAFAYYARPSGGGSGVAVLLAGALLLIAGGVLASRPQRNGPSAPSV